MKNKATTPKSSHSKMQHNDINSSAQRQRIIDHLHKAGNNGLTTIEIREELNCLHPCGRVMELRNMGYDIRTIWSKDFDHMGRPHRVARYVLFGSRGVCA